MKNGDMRATPIDQMSSDEDSDGNTKPHKMPFKPTKPITFDTFGKPLDVRPLVLAPKKEFRPQVNLNPKSPPKTPTSILKPGKSPKKAPKDDTSDPMNKSVMMKERQSIAAGFPLKDLTKIYRSDLDTYFEKTVQKMTMDKEAEDENDPKKKK